jgi:hypothetical protein
LNRDILTNTDQKVKPGTYFFLMARFSVGSQTSDKTILIDRNKKVLLLAPIYVQSGLYNLLG